MIGFDPETQHSFSFTDNHIVYNGRGGELPPSPYFIESHHKILTLLWLSGFNSRIVDCYVDGKHETITNITGKKTMSSQIVMSCYDEEIISTSMPSKVYVFPEPDKLAALSDLYGRLPKNDILLARKRLLQQKNHFKGSEDSCLVDCESMWGRVGQRLSEGFVCLNKHHTEAIDMGFFGKLLISSKYCSQNTDKTYMLLANEANSLFYQSGMTRRYAATCVPVKFKNTKKFSNLTGDRDEYVSVRLVGSSDHEGMHELLKFNAALTGDKYIILQNKKHLSLYNKKCEVYYNLIRILE